MKSKTKLCGAMVLTAAIAGCGAQSRIVLLPDANGRAGQIVVSEGKEQVLLDRPYQRAETLPAGWVVDSLGKEDVSRQYGAVIAQLPRQAQRFVLYFESGGETLTAESLAQLDAIRAALAEYPAPELLITGHTDRVGTVVANDALSLKRAEATREILVAAGFNRAAIGVAGRGEREPAIPTEDEIDEPKNRRVEVKLR